jgi:hypothetical protein
VVDLQVAGCALDARAPKNVVVTAVEIASWRKLKFRRMRDEKDKIFRLM